MGVRGCHPRPFPAFLFFGIVASSLVYHSQMAKTSYQLIPPELSLSYSKALTSGDRYTVPRVRRRVLYFSRDKLKGFRESSLIPSLSVEWQALTPSERTAWNNAGAVCSLSGFKLFLRDRALRLKNNLSGSGEPSLLHQLEVGLLRVEAPASHIRIAQLHPSWYYVRRKVRGSRDSFESVRVNESFGLPLNLAISYNADLVAAGPSPRARFFCVVFSHYQGRTIENTVEIPFTLGAGWTRAFASFSDAVGVARGYTAFIEIADARGDLLVDNIELEHSGQNWARDPFCNDIDQGFTGAFYQVPKHWVADDVPEGAFFGSVYYNG